jgi:predicted DNA-binding transcriptional regulator AlpA
MDSEFYTSKELCEVLHITPSTLRRWRKADIAPEAYAIGPQRHGYKKTDVAAWLEARRSA